MERRAHGFDCSKNFRVSGGKKKTGTTISYNDTLAATTTLTVLKPARGVRVKGRCLKPTKAAASDGSSLETSWKVR